VYSDFFEIPLPTLCFEKTEEINTDDQEFKHKGRKDIFTRHPSHYQKLQTEELRTILKETTRRNDGLRNKPEE
jgi:hypothetical protein